MDQHVLDTLARLGLALAIGLLVGLERGWRQRAQPEGSRVAGLRTFGVIGLSGGLAGLLGRQTDWTVLAAGFLAFAAIALFAFWRADGRAPEDRGSTTLFATLATFALGAAAAAGEMPAAASGAIALTVLLGLKAELHGGLARLKQVELRAAVQLLLISAVVLPVLPDRGFGPFEAINPYRLWLMVVLIAAVSFAGYVAMRVFGSGRGVILTGLFGGLVSSTAVALSLAGRAREPGAAAASLAAGIVIAASMMFWRCALIVTAIEPALGERLVWPMGLAGALGMAGGAVLALRRSEAGGFLPRDPAALATAMQFGLALAAVALLAQALRHWFGDAGLLALAGISGLVDVDAISLSVAGMVGGGLDAGVAATAIVLAAAVNTLVKIAIVGWKGTAALFWRVATPLAVALAGGAAGVLLPQAMS